MAKDLFCHTYYRHKHGAQQLQFPEDATHFRGRTVNFGGWRSIPI